MSEREKKRRKENLPAPEVCLDDGQLLVEPDDVEVVGDCAVPGCMGTSVALDVVDGAGAVETVEVEDLELLIEPVMAVFVLGAGTKGAGVAAIACVLLGTAGADELGNAAGAGAVSRASCGCCGICGALGFTENECAAEDSEDESEKSEAAPERVAGAIEES